MVICMLSRRRASVPAGAARITRAWRGSGETALSGVAGLAVDVWRGVVFTTPVEAGAVASIGKVDCLEHAAAANKTRQAMRKVFLERGCMV
jgi:hypothetical protein